MATNTTSTIPEYDNIPIRGINISGAEAGTDVSYAYMGMPDLQQDMTFYIDQGMNSMRFPINWNYITSSANSTQASAAGDAYLTKVVDSVKEMLDAGLTVILDLHNYMRFSPGSYAGDGNQIATAQQTYNIWSIISDKMHDVAVAHPDTLLFEVFNEPNSMKTTQVLANNNAGIDAIRDAGLTNMVVLEGNSWSGLHSWFDGGNATDGLSNAQVMTRANIIDPLNNYAIAVHQYVDWNGSGTSPTGQSLSSFKQYLDMDKFMDWVHANDMKVLLTEFGGGAEANSMTDVNYLLDQVQANPYVDGEGGFLGWTAWIGGHTWAQYNFNYVGPDANGNPNTLMQDVYIDHLQPVDGTYVPPVVDDPADPGVPGDGGQHTGGGDPTPTPQPEMHSQVMTWNWGARDIIQNFDVNKDAIDLSAYWVGYDRFSLHDDGQGNTIIDLLGVDNRLIKLANVDFDTFSAKNLIGIKGGQYSDALDGDAAFYSFKWDYGLKTTIDNFDIHKGVIELNTFSGKSFSDLDISQNGNDTIINLGFNGQVITLHNVTASQLTADNFYGLTGNIQQAYHGTVTPTPDPDPTPVPDPVPDPTPVPDPVPDPTPTPTPDPTPTPTPDPTPVPDPTPTPTPAQSETFNVGWNWGGRTVISNFDAANDKMDLTALWTNFNKFNIHEDGNGNLVIDLLDLNNQTVTLKNTSLAEFSSQNIKGVAGNYNDAVHQQAVKYYDFSWNYGHDSVIDNFDPNVGKINLSAFDKNFSDVHINSNSNGDAVINLDFDHQKITLSGVHANQIDGDNFFM